MLSSLSKKNVSEYFYRIHFSGFASRLWYELPIAAALEGPIGVVWSLILSLTVAHTIVKKQR